jgi:hypothetical protein
MKVPNVFLAGAPKCGTTSLATWLDGHPQVFMSPVKEPHHFCTDFGYPAYRQWDDYLALFDAASEDHRVVAEASATYLYSGDAVPNIERQIDAPRYIVLLRNPVNMAPALHEQLLFDGDEDVADFATAWRMQQARSEGNAVPAGCREPRFLQYREACSLGAQMARLFDRVPRERVLVMLLDDLGEDPRGCWRETRTYLGLDDDGRTEFPVMNTAKETRLPRLRRLVRAASRARQAVGMPSLARLGLGSSLDALSTRRRPRPPLPQALRDELTTAFHDDVKLLARLIDRDLDSWLVQPEQQRTHG